jgi:NADH-quinone oxidoreductase subunit L
MSEPVAVEATHSLGEAVRPYLIYVPGLPLLGAAVTGLFGWFFPKNTAHWPCVLAIAASCVLSLIVFGAVYNDHGHEPGVATYYQWITVSRQLPTPPTIHGDRASKAAPLSAVEQEQLDEMLSAEPNEDHQKKFKIAYSASGPSARKEMYEKFEHSGIDFGMTLRADALSAMMIVMVTFIATFIAIYAIGYMHDDPGYPRFFAAVSGFVAAMTLLVLGDNLFVLYAGWEGVGLCSYLLIGFWFYKESAAAAARKAFLVTRLGDVGLFLGILMLWYGSGHLDYKGVFDWVKANASTEQGFLFAAAMLVFCGAAGKSAQFPLHVWLPDAMEGPTPVSALIHAATMVTAGVYLVARCTPLYMVVPFAQLIIGGIGGFTALLAALIALTQTDLKRVLAYSTLSQLGYMFLALGCGLSTGNIVSFAVIAAMFHLFTHAFFKALLFLCAGSVMNAMGHVIDMRRFSGLSKVMPTTHWTFLVGALALSGFPLLSGFWSKDEILDAAYRASQHSPTNGTAYFVLLVVGLLTAFLTAFYTFRAYFRTFWGPLRVPAEADHHHGHGHDHGHDHTHDHGHSHGHPKKPAPEHDSKHPKESYESPQVMTVPLIVLSVFAIGVGFVLAGPLTPEWLSFAHFLERTPGFPHEAGEHSYNLVLMAISSVLALGGIGLAYQMYVLQPGLSDKVEAAVPVLARLSRDKFYFDDIYNAMIVRPLEALAQLLGGLDNNGVDALVYWVGYTPRLLANAFRPMQNGLVQFYALAMVLGLTVFLLALLRGLGQ